MRRSLTRLLGDARGATAVEFAAIAPAFLVTMLGIMDLSYSIYTSTIIEGAIQRAARDATIEGAEARGLEIDNDVREAVQDLVPNSKITFVRRSYTDFSDVARPEDYTDANGDGACNDGEPFEDANGNGGWDADRGSEDMGGARDAVAYSVEVEYPRAFPFMQVIGFDPYVTARSQTVLRNQPYGPQNKAAPVRNCP